MKLDLHAHCQPASPCAGIRAEELAENYAKAGFDGFVLTNHITRHLINQYPADFTTRRQAQMYVDTYYKAKECGEKIGIRVIFGAEVKLGFEPNHPEFLLYGFTPEQMLDSHPLYILRQRELFAYCEKMNILMIQAHPMREAQGYHIADLAYMHGIEVCNPGFDKHPEITSGRLIATARANNFVMSAGNDLHNKGQETPTGIILSSIVDDSLELRDTMQSGAYRIFYKDTI